MNDAIVEDWGLYPNFSEREFQCSHTSECRMHPDFMEALQNVRSSVGFPLVISSGYRSPTHPVERIKSTKGEHTLGLAADVRVFGEQALAVMDAAFAEGFRRFGFAQSGYHQTRFIHLGWGDKFYNSFVKSIWTY